MKRNAFQQSEQIKNKLKKKIERKSVANSCWLDRISSPRVSTSLFEEKINKLRETLTQARKMCRKRKKAHQKVLFKNSFGGNTTLRASSLIFQLCFNDPLSADLSQWQGVEVKAWLQLLPTYHLAQHIVIWSNVIRFGPYFSRTGPLFYRFDPISYCPVH